MVVAGVGGAGRVVVVTEGCVVVGEVGFFVGVDGPVVVVDGDGDGDEVVVGVVGVVIDVVG